MYIVELFYKLIEDYKSGKFKKKAAPIQNNIEKCDHLFVPIDSTGRILACSKCGQLYKLKKGEENPFK